jgi:anti-sigma factor RsiW
MRCPTETPESVAILLAYISDKLDEARAAEVAAHAEGCPACREFTARQRAVWQAMDAWVAPPVSADFDRRLYRRVESEISWWQAVVRPFRPVVGSRALPVAAAAGLLIAVGMWMVRPEIAPRIAAPASAQMEALPPEQAQSALEEMDMMQEFSQMVRSEAPSPRI